MITSYIYIKVFLPVNLFKENNAIKIEKVPTHSEPINQRAVFRKCLIQYKTYLIIGNSDQQSRFKVIKKSKTLLKLLANQQTPLQILSVVLLSDPVSFMPCKFHVKMSFGMS